MHQFGLSLNTTIIPILVNTYQIGEYFFW